MPVRAVDVVRHIAPHARPCYVQAFEHGDSLLAEAAINTPHRLAAFLAETMEETDAYTIERESGNYRAGRIMQIFGVGHHSAAVTVYEAARLAENGPALFERVYGQGNPHMARELGNSMPGDGWKYRGNGILQTTGRGNHRRYGEKCGVDFEFHPELVTAAEHALKPALAEWSEGRLNDLADIGTDAALTRISKKINGGYNGLRERIGYYHHVLPIIDAVTFSEAKSAVVITAEAIAPDIWHDTDKIKKLQQKLKDGGNDPGDVDGEIGSQTIRAFQRANNLKPDGVIGPKTRPLLENALKGN